MSDAEDKARIDELEAELQQLRAKVDEATPIDQLDPSVKPPGMTKMLLVGAIVVVLSLGFFVAVYTALSKGFSSLATKAASTYASELNEEDEQASSNATQPAQPKRRPPTVPGL